MSALGSGLVFLAAAVVAVPIFKRFKLGAILGYLVAGAIIGPSSFDWVSDPETILHFAELGVLHPVLALCAVFDQLPCHRFGCVLVRQ